jgi:hypothetical protein
MHKCGITKIVDNFKWLQSIKRFVCCNILTLIKLFAFFVWNINDCNTICNVTPFRLAKIYYISKFYLHGYEAL